MIWPTKKFKYRTDLVSAIAHIEIFAKVHFLPSLSLSPSLALHTHAYILSIIWMVMAEQANERLALNMHVYNNMHAFAILIM